MNIYIVRHCKAEGQSPEANLTQDGQNQAEKLAEFLLGKNIDGIISSPFARAYQSIYPFAMKSEIKLITDNRLSERILSDENHQNWREMLRNTFIDFELRYDGGESSNGATNRILAVIRDLKNSGLNNVVLVTHGNLMSLLLKHYDNRYGFEAWEALTNPDVYQLNFSGVLSSTVSRIWVE
ncbi:histidine phosphatase family protein [Paenibacillus sp. SYP-B3998]|uniref:Histidine phosphatase family protein n=1 Tax=Paenibacillus sp. SYP-B3998 TaxID=2678564 RepID=A0A6G3ZST2_9BACL|nr:histidine phosphatase family protein [Paenibacillus sp. SYP-B3998]NEW04649.1 histidine phosphatase family protein [Paenibacillus sp. SYP-B3998]